MEDTEVKQNPVDETVECSMCGVVGGPEAGCDLCHGSSRYRQARHFTLTEERQGKNPNANDRYGRYGEVGPKIAIVPGGAVPGSTTPR